ncbi:hypothetical protein [Streptomyces sp. NPDC055140]
MDLLADVKHHGITSLITSARNGLHSLPDGMDDDYTQLAALVAEAVNHRGIVVDNKAKAEAEKLSDKLMAYKAWGNGPVFITEHLKPALDAFLDELRADIKTAGRFAAQPAATIDMLDQPEDVRSAILRLHACYPKYGALRASWANIRRDGDTVDPLGPNSPLAEVANLPDLAPDWQAAYFGRAPWPWPSTVPHVRLGWLLANGGQLWLPTAAEQDATWRRYDPNAAKAAA